MAFDGAKYFKKRVELVPCRTRFDTDVRRSLLNGGSLLNRKQCQSIGRRPPWPEKKRGDVMGLAPQPLMLTTAALQPRSTAATASKTMHRITGLRLNKKFNTEIILADKSLRLEQLLIFWKMEVWFGIHTQIKTFKTTPRRLLPLSVQSKAVR
jgi:hypothetical protein